MEVGEALGPRAGTGAQQQRRRAALAAARAVAVVVCLLGGVVLASWVLGLFALSRVDPVFQMMKANTSLSFLMGGLAAWLLAGTPSLRRARAGRAAAGVVLLVSGLTLLEYAAGLDFGIDELLAAEVLGPVKSLSPGRMAPATAAGVALIGAALLARSRRRANAAEQVLAALAGFAGMLGLVGYVYGAEAFYAPGPYTSMAPHTATALVLLSLSCLFGRPDTRFLRLLTDDDAGGLLLRRLLPAAILVPILIGWLRWQGERQGLYDTASGLTLFALSNILVFTTLAFWTGASLHRMERERRRAAADLLQAHAALRASEQELRTAHGELEHRVEQRTADLAAANRELEAFSYSVSHDLRAPLRALDGFSRILLMDFGPQLPEDIRQYLEAVRSNTAQMGRLVDDLLRFSRLSRQPVSQQAVEPARLVGQCLDTLREAFAGRRVEVRLGELPSCWGDPGLLTQVWANLLANALKYTGKRDQAVVEVGCLPGNGAGERAYFVRDNGVGFDMRYAEKLFGVFQRLHRAEDYEGTGVGLAIVQRIVHRHGGRVWAEAEPDRGATFYFTLPEGAADA